MLVEMREYNESFSKLQAKISLTKQVNTLLSSRLVSIENQYWLNAQYSRQECAYIIGIPSEVKADAFEEKVVVIFERLGYNIPTERLEACHRISKKNPKSLSSFREGSTVSRFAKSERLAKNKDSGY